MQDKRTWLERLERLLRVIREAVVLILLAFVLYHVGPELPRIASQLKSADVDQLELLGIKLKVQQAEASLQAAVKAEAPEKGPEDQQVGEQAKLVADALHTLRTVALAVPQNSGEPTSTQPARLESSPSWVYLGARRSEGWVTRYFDVEALPSAGTSIRAIVDVFKRRHAPVFRDGQWVMGDAVGVLQVGDAVTVLRTQPVPGTESRQLWWAEVASR